MSQTTASFETLRFEQSDAVATITMNRPERRNALNQQLDQDLRTAFAHVGSDEHVRAVVLRGAGDGFCAGADLTVLKEASDPEDIYEHIMTRYLPLIERITTLEKPVLAAMNGTTAGAGCALALACDLRVMADDAHFMVAFSNIGFVPDSGTTWLLARQIGYSRAFEMAAEAKPVPADRCLELGLTNRVVPADQIWEAAQEWATELAKRPTLALGLTKQALHSALSHSLTETIEQEAQLQKRAAASHDHREGVQAFLEKRKPEFKGR